MAGEFDLRPEQMREYGYRVIDALVEHWSGIRQQPAMRVSSRESLEGLLREPLPLRSTPFESVLREAREKPLSSIGHLTHPRFFGFIPSPSNFVFVLADAQVPSRLRRKTRLIRLSAPPIASLLFQAAQYLKQSALNLFRGLTMVA